MRQRLIWLSAVLWLGFFAHLARGEDDLPEATYSDAEIAQLLAPVALYPDTLLSQILVASTYPLEVVQAARWSAKHPDLEGQEAVDAVQDKSWDPSVKALVAFPRILARMSDDLDWTEKLGDAFLEDEQRVLAQVQTLRRKADEAGRLDDLQYARVQRDQETRTIVIEPRVTQVVYVPFYDPFYVYGGWYWDAYPPVVWLPPHHHHFPVGVYWSPGVHLSVGFFFTGFHWHSHRVVVWHHRHRPLRYRDIRHARLGTDVRVWRHDPVHRRGVVYRSPRAQHRVALSTRNRPAERGHDTRTVIRTGNRQVIRPGNAENRPHLRTETGRPRADAVEQRLRERHSGHGPVRQSGHRSSEPARPVGNIRPSNNHSIDVPVREPHVRPAARPAEVRPEVIPRRQVRPAITPRRPAEHSAPPARENREVIRPPRGNERHDDRGDRRR